MSEPMSLTEFARQAGAELALLGVPTEILRQYREETWREAWLDLTCTPADAARAEFDEMREMSR